MEFAGFETIRASYPGDIGLGVIRLWVYQKFYPVRSRRACMSAASGCSNLCRGHHAARGQGGRDPGSASADGYEAEGESSIAGGMPATRRYATSGGTREWSLDELHEILRMLDVHMDVWFFESEVRRANQGDRRGADSRGIAEDERPSGGPVIVKIDEKLGLKKEKYRTNVILRSDGTTLYLTKDLALAKMKFEQYHVDRSIYVVDVRQSLHLQQAFKILELWGFPQAEKCYHLGYGFVTLPEGTMSARGAESSCSRMSSMRRAARAGRSFREEPGPSDRNAWRSPPGRPWRLALFHASVDNIKTSFSIWKAR